MVIPLVMGVLNVTPDSFSDGGRYLDLSAATARGSQMLAEGADVIDVGGESTRPGAEPVEESEELRRVVPVVEALAPLALACGARISVDTTKAAVGHAALRAGATLLNDVSAELAEVAAAHGAGFVAMHRQGLPSEMQRDPHYHDVVVEVADELADYVAAARAVGVEELYVDPGIGFGKSVRHNLDLLGALPALVARGVPVLVGTSRKGFLGHLGAGGPVEGRVGDVAPLAVADRFEESLATATFAMAAGVAMVRVHDVAATVQAARLVGRKAA